MKKTLLSLLVLPIIGFSQSQKINSQVEDYSAYFEKAYQQYSSIPRGVLEAVAYTNTHIQNITHNPNDEESCVGLPEYYGVMGLVQNGKNVFRNNLLTVSQLSGIPVHDIMNSPEKNILAYAAAYAQVQQNTNSVTGKAKAEAQIPVLIYLSELPDNGSLQNNFAMNTNLYSVLNFLNSNENAQQYNFPQQTIDMESVFGTENYKVLSSSSVTVMDYKITDKNGNEYEFDNSIPQNNLKKDPPSILSADYASAIWNAAASCNYTSGRTVPITAVVIHDTEGSYAGSISWFQDCSSKVSAHYVIRSSDGQITQMVLEKNKAWHVGSENPYTIGIEHEGYQAKTGWYTTAMYQNSANLVKDICSSGYGINPTTCWNGASCSGSCVISSTYRIKGHQHYPNQTHDDPGPNWNWYTYYSLINGSTPPPPPATPANDNCSAAQSLTSNTTCVSTSGNLANATTSGLAKASCDVSSSSTLKDVWYKFTATASTHTITFTPSSGLDGVLSLYSSCSGTQLGCSDNGGGKGGVEKISASALTTGNTYYLRVYSYGSTAPTTTTFNICVTAPAPVSCGVPAGLSATAITSTSATLNWSSVSGATSYNVQYKPTASSTWTTSSSTTNSKAISGLIASTAYQYQVQTVCSSGTSVFSSVSTFTTLSSSPPPVNCSKTLKTTIEGFNVYQHNSGAIMFKAKMAIDADGSPRAYGPNNSGLDYTANAGSPGNWWGVVTDSNGNPIKQTSSDPYPGMYVSTTSLVDNAYGSTKTQHYVNSEAIPFFVLPSAITAMGIKLGDVGYVYNTANGKGCYAIFADGGPSGKLGEGSIYLANQLGINSNPKTGGVSSGIDYIVFPNSGYGQGTIPTVAQINTMGTAKINSVGGTGITSCLPIILPPAETEMRKGNTVENSIADNNLILYPNPSDGIVLHGKFSITEDNIINIKIYDMTGREIVEKKINVAGGEFSLAFDEHLKIGMYMLVGIASDKQYVQRIIVR